MVDVSGLVAGVDIGVVLAEPGGVGEQLAVGGELRCGSSLSASSVEMSSPGSPTSSSLPFSNP